MCAEWRDDFSAFLRYLGDKPPGMTLERIDRNGNYEPGNVRWATKAEQCRNTRRNRFLDIDGRRMTIAEWARELGKNQFTIYQRLNRGVPLAEAIS